MSKSDFNKLSELERKGHNLRIAEETVNNPLPRFFHNVTRLGNTNGRLHSEPVSVAIKYAPDGGLAHAVVFENQPAYKLDAFITQHYLNKGQELNFNNSIPTGPIIGSTKTRIKITQSPTVAPTHLTSDSATPTPTTPSTGTSEVEEL